MRDGHFDETADVRALDHVGSHGEDIHAQGPEFCSGLFQSGLAARADRDPGARLRQRLRHGAADAFAPAGDQRHAAF